MQRRGFHAAAAASQARCAFCIPSKDVHLTSARSVVVRGADGLIVPHGGKLKDLFVRGDKERAALIASTNGRSLELSDRNACDVELLSVGCVLSPEAFVCASEGGSQRVFTARWVHERRDVHPLR